MAHGLGREAGVARLRTDAAFQGDLSVSPEVGVSHQTGWGRSWVESPATSSCWVVGHLPGPQQALYAAEPRFRREFTSLTLWILLFSKLLQG